MKKELDKLDDLKGNNPFLVPEGYMEGLTSQIMSRLPEKEITAIKEISLMERIRPWLYMAAVFVGLGLFFKVIVGIGSADKTDTSESFLVQSQNPTEMYSSVDQALADEDADYLDYLEKQYADYFLVEDIFINE